MGTDTSSALAQKMTAANPKPARDKVMRIATIVACHELGTTVT